jgi:hypothetical protein
MTDQDANLDQFAELYGADRERLLKTFYRGDP